MDELDFVGMKVKCFKKIIFFFEKNLENNIVYIFLIFYNYMDLYLVKY